MKPHLPFKIIFEDDYLIVIDKPNGLLSTHTALPTRLSRENQLTAENLLTDYIRKGQLKSRKRVYLVHRLDRDTSGVMMFAKSERIATEIRNHWHEITEKTYLARVRGKMEAAKGTYTSSLIEDERHWKVHSTTHGGKLAVTSWQLLNTTGKNSLVKVKLHSGRKHQIRVHFSEHAHPVIGDRLYGGDKAPRLMLHSYQLSLVHPVFGKRLTFEATPKYDFGAI